ncbi:hypothetical protein BH23CHL4_BH23CHL4_24250 [soil metagenome]
MDPKVQPLSQYDIDSIIRGVAPGGHLVAADRLEGGISATITYLEFELPDGTSRRVIVRQYGLFDLAANPGVAMHEEALLEILVQQGLPVPEPLLSETGFRDAGRTWLVTGFIEGTTITEPPFPERFAEQIAETLTSIHAVDPTLADLAFLPDGHDQAAMQIEANVQSSHLSTDEHGYWHALETRWPSAPAEPRSLLHGDFWPGNLIWKDGKIAGMIDWEDARLGHPLEDVANCRLELYLSGGAELADAFSDTYGRLRSYAGYDRLRLWELYIAARLNGRIARWGLEPGEEAAMRQRVETFASEALRQLTAS